MNLCEQRLLVPNQHHPWHVDNLSAKGDCILHLCPAGMSPDFDYFACRIPYIVINALDALPTLLIRNFFHSIYLWVGWSAPWLKVVLLSTLVASLPSGRALAISLLISTKSAFWPVEGRVTWPSCVRWRLSINCTNWLLCSARNQIQLLTGLFWSFANVDCFRQDKVVYP